MKLRDGLRVSTHDDGAVILDPRCGRVFSANLVGARVIAFLEGHVSLEEMTARISSEFQAEADRVACDVGRFLESLRSNGLLAG